MPPSSSVTDDWFASVASDQRPLLLELRELILAASPGLTEEIKWSQPCYKHHRHVCYLNKAKEYVTLGFQQGAHLSDPSKLLEGTGKDMRHVKVRASGDIKRAEFTRLVKAAIKFDEAGA